MAPPTNKGAPRTAWGVESPEVATAREAAVGVLDVRGARPPDDAGDALILGDLGAEERQERPLGDALDHPHAVLAEHVDVAERAFDEVRGLFDDQLEQGIRVEGRRERDCGAMERVELAAQARRVLPAAAMCR